MAELSQVMQALRNAHTSGNAEDAKRLAVIANKMRSGTDRTPKLSQERQPRRGYEPLIDIESTKPTEKHSGMMPFVNRSIAETAGAVPDLIRAGVNLLPGMDESNKLPEPMLGRKSIETTMGSSGIGLPAEGQKAETIPEHMGQIVGQAAALINPASAGIAKLGKAGSVVKTGINAFGRPMFQTPNQSAMNLTGKVASSVWQSMIKHPYLTMTSELTGAMSSGAGRGIAEKEFPDSPGTQTAIELGAGLAGAMAPTAIVHAPTAIAIRAGKNILHKVLLPFTKRGGMYRAGKHVKGLVAKPEVVATDIAEETISDLPPAVASGEKRIIELYKGLTGQDPVVDGETIEKMTSAVIKLEGEMRKFGYGSPELLEEMTKKRIAAIELGIDKRVLDSATKAQAKIEALPVAQRKSLEARIVRKELEDTMYTQKKKDQKLWNAVNKDFKVNTDTTRHTYKTLKDGLGQAQKVDIPVTLKGSKVIIGKKVKGQEERDFGTNLREMQALRSKLLETSRAARKEGQWNKSRIAEDVADAILEDLEIAAKGTEASDLKAALAATKKFKMRFESGEVGRILGYSRSGAPAINPDLTLEMTIGRMGERGAIDLNKVVVTPEAKKATARYLARSFTDYATDPKSGTLNRIKSDRWVKTNEAILDEFPTLKSQLSDSTNAQSFADETRIRMNERKKALQDPRISSSAMFLNKADMGQEVEYIFKTANPVRTADELVKQAQKDVTGDALYGLRAGFVEHILEKSTVGSFNELGEQTLSGRAMLNFIKKNEVTLRKVFDSEQILRMKKIGAEFSKIETFEKSGDTTKIEMTDWASKLLEVVARLGGAEVGGKLGGGSMGGSLIHAQIISGKARAVMNWLSKDRAQQLVQDAIMSQDPNLLQSLLNPITKPTASKKDLIILNKNLNLWLLSTGQRVMEDIETNR